VKRKDLEKIDIDDSLLLQLLELPPHAFEIYTDPVTGYENIRVKSAFLRDQAKLIRCKIKTKNLNGLIYLVFINSFISVSAVVTEKVLSNDDFEVEIDAKTGEKRIKLKSDVAKKLGIPEGAEDLIEVFTDENGKQILRLKDGARSIKIGIYLGSTLKLPFEFIQFSHLIRKHHLRDGSRCRNRPTCS